MAKQNWVTQKELAAKLGLTPQVIQNWVQRGNINWKIMYGVKVVDSNSIKKGARGRPIKAKNKVKSD